MSVPVTISPEAYQDLSDAADWYESEAPGKSLELRAQFQSALAFLRAFPRAGHTVFRGARRIRLHQFPYHVYYRLSKGSIRVLALYHCARDPKGWRRRSG